MSTKNNLVLTGLSICLLTACSASDVVKQEVDKKIDQAREKVEERVEVRKSEVKERVQERAGDIKEQVQERVQERVGQARERFSENAQERVGSFRENIQQRRQSRLGGRLRDRLGGQTTTGTLISPSNQGTVNPGNGSTEPNMQQDPYSQELGGQGEFSDSKETINQLRRRRGRLMDRLRNR